LRRVSGKLPFDPGLARQLHGLCALYHAHREQQRLGVAIRISLRWPPSRRVDERLRRSRPPAGAPIRPPVPAADRIDPPPRDIRSPRFRPRHSRCPSTQLRKCYRIGTGHAAPSGVIAESYSLRPVFSDDTSERCVSLVSKLSGAIEAGRVGDSSNDTCHVSCPREHVVANERSIFLGTDAVSLLLRLLGRSVVGDELLELLAVCGALLGCWLIRRPQPPQGAVAERKPQQRSFLSVCDAVCGQSLRLWADSSRNPLLTRSVRAANANACRLDWCPHARLYGHSVPGSK
jgi:hypothetical protein